MDQASTTCRTAYRRNYSLTPLGDGRTLVSGGYDQDNRRLGPIIYDARQNEWIRIKKPRRRVVGEVAVIDRGKVLFAGDHIPPFESLPLDQHASAQNHAAEIYYLDLDGWADAPSCRVMPPFASAGLISAGGGVVVLYGVSYPDNVADPNRIAAYHASEDVWKVSPKAPFSTSHRGRTEVLVLSMDEVLFNGSHVYRVRANKWEKFTRKWFTVSRARYFRNGSNLYAIGMTDSLDGGVQVLDLNSWKFSPPKTIHGVLGHNVMVLDDNSLLIFGGSHGDTIIGDRDGKRGWLERVLHMSPKADKVHQIYELPKEQAMSSFIPIGDNRAVLLGADCTTSFLLSYAQGRLSVNQRPAATFLLSNEQQWIEEWLFKCESPAEEAFLVEAIKQFDLQPVGSRLEGECVLEMQVKIDRSRVDFLFDGSVIVEVDGHQFHSGVEESKRDAARDSVLRAKGFRLLRITAHRIFHAPEAAVADVRDMLR